MSHEKKYASGLCVAFQNKYYTAYDQKTEIRIWYPRVWACDFPGAKPRVDKDCRSLKYSNAHGKINRLCLLREASGEIRIT